MNKTAIGAFFAVPLIAGGSIYLTPVKYVYHADYTLTGSEAMVIIPVDNQEYADLATSLYLRPSGFDGTDSDVSTLNIPEVIPGVPNVGGAVDFGVQQLVDAIEKQYDAGVLSADDPLYIFGYSQAAVVESLAEQQLHDYGVPKEDLHFVMVGDSASAHGGFVNSFLDSLPESWREFIADTLNSLGYGDVVGAITPNDLYPTDVYSLTGDGWVNWDNGANFLGMFVDHLEYLGLSPEEVNSATSVMDGLSDYHTIDSATVDGFSALLNTIQMATSVFF
jgi:hypothetical protein